MKKSILLFSVCLLFVFFLSLPAAAFEGICIDNTDPALLSGLSDLLLEDFESADGFVFSENAEKVECVSSSAFPPYLPIGGKGMLLCRVASLKPDEWILAEKKWAAPLDLSEFQSFFSLLSCDCPTDLALSVKIVFLAGEEEYPHEALLFPGKAHSFVSLLPESASLTEVTGFRIEIGNTSSEEMTDLSFLLDSLSLSLSSSITSSLRFLAEDFRPSDGSSLLSESDDAYTFLLKGNNPTLDAVGFATSSRRICLSFSGGIDATNLRVAYTTLSSPRFDSQKTVGCELFGDTLLSAVFTLPEENCTGLRFLFPGEDLNETVTFYSMTPLPVYNGMTTPGSITEVSLSGSLSDIVLRGSLGDGISDERLAGARLMLYELSPYENASTSPLLTYTPIALQDAAREFVFRFSLLDENGRSRVASKFLVAFSDGRTLEVIDAAHYLSDPASLSGKAPPAGSAAPKGFSSLSRADLIAADASHTSLTIECEKMITLGASRFEATVDGETVYFSETYLKKLDKMIGEFKDTDIEVTAHLTVKSSGDSRIDSILIHPDADLSKPFAAFNTTDRIGTIYFRAIVSFLIRRYSGEENGRISRFVLGEKADRWGETYSVGTSSMEKAVSSYALALRLLSIECEKEGMSGSVYASFSGNALSFVPSGTLFSSDVCSFLTYLRDLTAEEGAFSWGIACDPFDAIYRQTESGPEGDYASLAALLSRFEKKILIDEHVFFPIPEEKASADYIRAYTAFASTGLLTAFITDRALPDLTLMRLIDTQRAPELVRSLLESAGEPDAALLSEAVEALPCRLLAEFPAKSETGNVTGSYLIGDFSEDENGWKPGENVGSLNGGQTILGRENLLVFELNGEGGIRRVFSDKLDLTSSPRLTFSFNIVSLPDDLDRAKVTVAFASGRNRLLFQGEARLGEWIPLVCDLTECEGLTPAFDLSSIDSISVTVSSSDGREIGQPLAAVTGMELLSDSLDSEALSLLFRPAEEEDALPFFSPQNQPLVWGLAAAALLSATLLILRAAMRQKKEKENG